MRLAAVTLREVACLAYPFSGKVFVIDAGIPNISSPYSFSSLLNAIDQAQSVHLDVALFVRNCTNIRAHSMWQIDSMSPLVQRKWKTWVATNFRRLEGQCSRVA